MNSMPAEKKNSFREPGEWTATEDECAMVAIAGPTNQAGRMAGDETALIASEMRYRRLFETAKDGILILDAETGMVEDVNPYLTELLGLTKEQFLRRKIWDLGSFRNLIANQEKFAELKRTKYVRYDNLPLETADGRRIDVEFVSNVYLVNDSKVIQCNIRNITERRQAEAALQASEKRLEEHIRQSQKMEAVGTLAGGIAHDFNNILAAITGYTELSVMTLKENPEVREYLGEVLRAAKRATDLVRQILTFSRQQSPERRPILLQSIVAEGATLLRATIPSIIKFEVSLAADAPMVLADATQIHQILMNLGTNAWQAMKDRPGCLQVKLEKFSVEASGVDAQLRLRPGVYARVSVSDTGCGMDPATLRRMFEPFFTTKAPGGGTGLGLAVVHGIMDSHDGVIMAESKPGEGTVFRLYFPAYAGEAAAAEDGLVPRGHGERILVVDDEESLGQLGRKILATLGYTVEVATQPAAALAMVRADPGRFALVLTDQTMPGMTGLVFASQLRQIRPGLPIILMTGYSLSLTSEQLEAAGICQILLKPTTLYEFGAAMNTALSTGPVETGSQS
jgi:PAS domain S-box-containing protein